MHIILLKVYSLNLSSTHRVKSTLEFLANEEENAHSSVTVTGAALSPASIDPMGGNISANGDCSAKVEAGTALQSSLLSPDVAYSNSPIPTPIPTQTPKENVSVTPFDAFSTATNTLLRDFESEGSASSPVSPPPSSFSPPTPSSPTLSSSTVPPQMHANTHANGIGNGNGNGNATSASSSSPHSHQPQSSSNATCESIVSADDFLPLFTYVVVQANLPQLLVVKEVIGALGGEEDTYGECSYYLATLEAATQHICDLAKQYTEGGGGGGVGGK